MASPLTEAEAVPPASARQARPSTGSASLSPAAPGQLIPTTRETVWTWASLAAAVGLWGLGIAGHQLTDLSLTHAPFLGLGPAFWCGLACAQIAFFAARTTRGRYLGAVAVACYFWLTVPAIFPLGYMHDSAKNVMDSPGTIYPHGTFPGAALFFRTLEQVSGIPPQDLNRYFPALAFLSYPIFLAALGRRISQLAGVSYDIGPLLIYFAATMGSAFSLRINAAPQTVGYMLFIVTLVHLIKRDDARAVVLSLLALGAMVITHPISPLMAIGGFYAILFMNRRLSWQSPVPSFVVLTLVLYCAWILYRGDWMLTSAFHVVQQAVNQEKPVPVVGSGLIPGMQSYLVLNRAYLLLLILTLAAALVIAFRQQRRITYAVLVWGGALAPLFALLYGAHDFFDRVLLFGFIPAAVLFAVAYGRLLGTQQRGFGRRAAIAGLMTLSGLSAATSYFYTANVDRVTARETAGENFVAQYAHAPADLGGFQLPLTFSGPVLEDDRGTFDGKYFGLARVVLITQQFRFAAETRQGAAYGATPAGKVEHHLRTRWDLVFDDGQDRAYARGVSPRQ